MKLVSTILRVVLAIPLIVFGLNSFLHFIPMPEVNAQAGAFLGALASAKLIFPLIGAIEVISGILLLLKKAIPFALIMLFPILLGATIYHIVLEPAGTLMALVCLLLNIALMIIHRERFSPLFN